MCPPPTTFSTQKLNNYDVSVRVLDPVLRYAIQHQKSVGEWGKRRTTHKMRSTATACSYRAVAATITTKRSKVTPPIIVLAEVHVVIAKDSMGRQDGFRRFLLRFEEFKQGTLVLLSKSWKIFCREPRSLNLYIGVSLFERLCVKMGVKFDSWKVCD